jgi:hypothetical protein
MAKPNLAYIPATIGDKVYSILPNDGVGDFDFTRGSEATRINAQGLIETVASGENRLNYPMIDGFQKGCPHHILEPARTNVVTNSNEFSGSETNVSVSRNQLISPDGTLNADRVLDNSNSGEHIITGSFSGAITSGLDYTSSAFFKSDGTGGKGVIRFYTGSFHNAVFNLEDGTISYTSSGVSKIENYGNGWYRCSLKVTAGSNYANTITQLAVGNSLNQFSYQGASSLGVYFWGVQFEQGSFPTSYIPTTSAAVTRAAETCNGSGNAATFNDSEGVLMAEIAALADDGTSRQISISNGGTTERVYFGFRANSNEFILSSRDSSYLIANVSDVTNFNKYAFQYKSGNFKAFVNGFNYDLTLDGGLLPSGLDTLNFDAGNGTQNFYGNTKQIQYFDSILDSEQLEQLTSWDSFRAMAEGQLYSVE